MQALQLTRFGSRAELRDVAVPQPGAGEVLLEIIAAGACHSDLHLMEWPEGQLPWRLPFTLGHENVGRVHALGDGARGVKIGDTVLVYGPWGCGTCRPCRLGRENYCDQAASIASAGGGLGRDGGMAEFMLVPSPRLLVPIGALDPVQAAPLADAALTPYHAIRTHHRRLIPGSATVVIGVGGLGHMAIQLLGLTSATRIIAVDVDPRRLARARELGAAETVIANDEAAEIIRAATGGLGADLVLDLVGNDQTLAMGAAALRAEGHLVIIGLGGGRVSVDFFTLPYGAQVSTSYWGTIAELMELVSLAQTGKLPVQTETFPLSHATDAYDRLRRGAISGRAVIVPS